VVNWPWTRKLVEAGHGSFYGKVSEDSKGLQVTSYQLNKDMIRLPHPNNMSKYETWLDDAEARVALEVLTKIIAGVGYYTEMDEEYRPKKEGDPYHKNKILVDEYGKNINLDEDLQVIVHMMLAKGFCPVELKENDDSQYDLNIMPAESFYRYINKEGDALKYTQERSLGDIIAEWETPEEKSKIILFYFGWSPTRPYGHSLLEPIGELLDSRKEMNIDMPKAIKRWSSPQVVAQSTGPKADIEQAFIDKDPEEAVFLGNINDGEFRIDTIGIDPQARFIPYIELIYYQIAEGLHAPLLLYLKNATEASATVMMESVDRLVNGVQRYVKRRVEKYLFEPQTGDPVPRIVWGQPKTGLEDITFTDLSSIMPYLAQNQQQHVLKQYLGSLPEPEWPTEPELPNQPQNIHVTPQIPVEKLVAQLNDIHTQLDIIKANFHTGHLGIAEACRLADRTITVHMKQLHGDHWQRYRDEMFKEFVGSKLLKVKRETYTVSVD